MTSIVKKIYKVIVILVLSFLLHLDCYAHHKIRLGIITIRDQNDSFFSAVVNFTRAACNNLNMDLVAIYANDNYEYLSDNIEKLISEKKIDAMLVLNYKEQLTKTVTLLEKNKIPFFIYNSGLAVIDYKNLKMKFKYFIGHMLPNDEYAGHLLAKNLIEKSVPNSKGEYHLLVLGGGIIDQASIKRINGLKKYISESKKKIIIDKIVYLNWDRHVAVNAVKNLLHKYSNVTTLWAASDGMALGASESIQKLKKTIAVGGIDWSVNGVAAVNTNILTATVGGHFMEGGWISVLIYDYFHGIQFSQENEINFTSWMALINKNNSQKYLKFLKDNKNWEKIDFKKLSKAYNSNLKTYDFSQKIPKVSFLMKNKCNIIKLLDIFTNCIKIVL